MRLSIANRRLSVLLAVSMSVLLAVSTVTAAAATDTAPLVVGVKEAPPFVIRAPDGSLTGITIDLFERVAETLDRQYRYEEADLAATIDGVADGRFDVGAGALTITAEREARVDFSHAFYTTGFAIAVSNEQANPVTLLFRRLVSLEFLKALVALIAVLMLVGLALWVFERRRNEEMFGGTPARGIGASFWWAAVTMTTVGYGDKAPVTPAGRLIAIVWMFAAIIIISSFTAAIATSLTVGSLEGSVSGVDDLPRVAVGTVAASSSENWLDTQRIQHRDFPDLAAGLAQLAAGEIDAVVYDEPLLKYLVNRDHSEKIRVLEATFERQDYGFSLPPGSALREPINRAILSITAGPEWSTVVEQYLGED